MKCIVKAMFLLYNMSSIRTNQEVSTKLLKLTTTKTNMNTAKALMERNDV